MKIRPYSHEHVQKLNELISELIASLVTHEARRDTTHALSWKQAMRRCREIDHALDSTDDEHG